MITTENYEEKINEIGIENLSPAQLESHNFIIELTRNYADWSGYHKAEEIRKMIDVYFQRLTEIFEHRKDQKQGIIKDFYNQLPQHERALLSAGTLPDAKKKLAEKLNIRWDDLLAFAAKNDTQANKQNKKAKEVSKPQAKTKKAKTEHPKKETGQNIQQVEQVKEEVKFIKRFVALNNRPKERKQILSLLTSLQKAITTKLIRKTSPLVDEIRFIQEKLVYLCNNFRPDQLIKMNLDDEPLAKLVVIAGGEKVYVSIGFIKRYIGMQGKEIERSKAEALAKQIENALSKEKIMGDDPYLERVKTILKSLRRYIAGKDGEVSITSAELNGLKGIVNGCSCSKDLGRIYNTTGKKLRECKKKTYSDAGRGACSHNGGLSGILTAEQIANRKFDLLNFTYPWAELIGNPGKNFDMMVHGEPGGGKTTFLFKFVKYLANNFGKVLYVSSEEFASVTLTKKVRELLSPFPKNLHFTENTDNVNFSDYQFVIFDSINDLGFDISDYKAIRQVNPNTAFIMILQHTKEGTFRGGKEWEHEMEIAGRIENGVIEIYKNRYGVKGTMNFFEKKEYTRFAA